MAWIDAFLRRADPARTRVETEFVTRQCPQPDFVSLLDVPCGLGRHTRTLAAGGYRVLGVDRDSALIEEAARGAPSSARFAVHDMAQLDALPGAFDAVVCLWQRFGWLDDEGNAAVLRSIAGKLRPRGRFVLDVLHRGVVTQAREPRVLDAGGVRIEERREMRGMREVVTLTYPDGASDVFDWRVYTPAELIWLGRACGLACVLACSRFDEEVPASEAAPSMQLVFERC